MENNISYMFFCKVSYCCLLKISLHVAPHHHFSGWWQEMWEHYIIFRCLWTRKDSAAWAHQRYTHEVERKSIPNIFHENCTLHPSSDIVLCPHNAQLTHLCFTFQTEIVQVV